MFWAYCVVSSPAYVGTMGDALEIDIQGIVLRCYRTASRGEDLVDHYIVAGFGSISVARDSGEIVNISAITPSGAALLKQLAPLIHRRESGKYRV